jgi:hypothetical protein
MSKDKPPREQTDTERQVMERERERKRAEFAAIRLRVLGPTDEVEGKDRRVSL